LWLFLRVINFYPHPSMKINFEKLEPVANNKLGQLSYDRANQLMYGKFEGIPTLELIKQIFEKLLIYAQTNKVVGSIYDLTSTKGTFTSANSYIMNEVTPPMMKMGYRCGAVIISNDPFTKFAANALISMTLPKGIEIKMVSNIIQAEEWVAKTLQKTNGLTNQVTI
jgi:hypothetical protein